MYIYIHNLERTITIGQSVDHQLSIFIILCCQKIAIINREFILTVCVVDNLVHYTFLLIFLQYTYVPTFF